MKNTRTNHDHPHHHPQLATVTDLKARRIVDNWMTLRRWIEHEGFPPGTVAGPNTRAWTDAEISQWIAERPTARAAAADGEAA